MSKKPNDDEIANDNRKVRVTRLGAGKVSTGAHVAAVGDTMAGAGAILAVPHAVAQELDARGLAEIQ